jgi:hypothetical protein
MKIRNTIAAAALGVALALSTAAPPARADEQNRQNFADWAGATIHCDTNRAPLAEVVCREVLRLARAEAARTGGFGLDVRHTAAEFDAAAATRAPLIEVLVTVPGTLQGFTAVGITVQAGVRYVGPVGVRTRDSLDPRDLSEARRSGFLVMWDGGYTSVVPADQAAAMRLIAPMLADVVKELFDAIREGRPQGKGTPQSLPKGPAPNAGRPS